MTEQLDYAVPLLDSLGFKATFYVTAHFEGFKQNVQQWKQVAAGGHELGNHTLFHPCSGGGPGREWVNPTYDLDIYNPERMADEIRMANLLLQSIDGRSTRTFAYPCGDTLAGDASYVDAVRDAFPAARGVSNTMQTVGTVNLYIINSFMVNGESGKELAQLVQQAINQQSWIVFLFHGVGGGHSLNVDRKAHRALLTFIKKHEGDLWIAPVVDIAGYMKKS